MYMEESDLLVKCLWRRKYWVYIWYTWRRKYRFHDFTRRVRENKIHSN